MRNYYIRYESMGVDHECVFQALDDDQALLLKHRFEDDGYVQNAEVFDMDDVRVG